MENESSHIEPQLPDANNPAAFWETYESRHPALIAELFSSLSAAEIWSLLQYTDNVVRAEVFSHLAENIQEEILDALSRSDAVSILTDMSPDDRANLFNRLSVPLQEFILPVLAHAERENIRLLSAYEEGTAGAVMTSDYATLAPEMTTLQAIDHLRKVAPNSETIYYSYVLNEQRQLLGFVSLRSLITAPRLLRVEEMMHKDVIFARVEDDQEDVARKIQKFDFLALPVIDDKDVLVGIVTHDDAIDIITQEHTEDLEKLMAIGGSHEGVAYMRTPVLGHFKNRYPWVIALAMLGMLSGIIVQRFEGLMAQFAILAMFMPMLADTGGNTGSQSATLVVRALALKEISARDALRILGKEVRVAMMLAVVLGIIAFGRVYWFSGSVALPSSVSLVRIAFAIALALGLQVITSTLIGALLPLGAAKMKWDPAVVASPALTTVVDITGLLIYFSTVTLVVGSI